MLNPELYAALKSKFGDVRVTNAGLRRVETGDSKSDKQVLQAGEHYNVCCPLCSDSKFRLSFSYKYLTKIPMSTRRDTSLANCYNEHCDVRSHEFWEPLLEAMDDVKNGILLDQITLPASKPRERVNIRLPTGLVPLHQLPEDHAAITFLKGKYHASLSYKYLSTCYGASFTDMHDTIYPKAQNRIIFPVMEFGKLVAWQGRTVIDETPRWYLPPGFIKTVYNIDRIMKHEVPIVAEGITSAIACGPHGTGIFGKEITDIQAKMLADRFESALIATDPETFLPDSRNGKPVVYAHKTKAILDRYMAKPSRFIRWPAPILELAKRKLAGEDVDVPDPASLGMAEMHALLKEVYVT